uniref:Endonuclease/exonuclease/phosphatase domain-containing protein n=1 Tax=Glossina pallidipes TaxID=7398 RepID=A0A1A9Z4M5_GLOPL
MGYLHAEMSILNHSDCREHEPRTYARPTPWNTSWRDIVDNPNGKVRHNWFMDNRLEAARISNITPSYPKGVSFLNYFLLGPELRDKILPNFRISCLPMFSDHLPLKPVLRIDPLIHSDPQGPRILTSYSTPNVAIFLTTWNQSAY